MKICDIREEEKVTATVNNILSTHGRIDGRSVTLLRNIFNLIFLAAGLINNAGGQFSSPLANIKGKGFDAVVRNNLTGGFLFSREVYNQWMCAHGGSIVNVIADMWMGMPNMGHSGAARAGMLNLTETAALEWAPVRVNAIAPGWIDSSGMDQYPEDVREAFKKLPEMVPLRRLGTESEVSAAITFLLSPAAAFISGSCLRVDGAAPNAKRIWGETVGVMGKSTVPFDGFHLARSKKTAQ